MTHPQIAAFARLAKENTPPTRSLEGQKTLISRTVHGFGYDAIHDEIVVTSPLTQAILVFRGGANGEEPPIRVIQGQHTQILGDAYGGDDKISVDPVNNEILLSAGTGGIMNGGPVPNSILIFDREAKGDVPPKRVLIVPDSQVKGKKAPVQVDALHDLLLVNIPNAMLIYDRTATGNAKPKAVITGPRSQMGNIDTFELYPQKNWIIGACTGGSICAWNIFDNGNAPPRWRIPVQQLTGYAASGIALDPIHKEIFLSAAGQGPPVPSGIMNTVITFSWPEIF